MAGGGVAKGGAGAAAVPSRAPLSRCEMEVERLLGNSAAGEATDAEGEPTGGAARQLTRFEAALSMSREERNSAYFRLRSRRRRSNVTQSL